MAVETKGADEASETAERRIRIRAYGFRVDEGRPEVRAFDHRLRAKREAQPAPDAGIEEKRLEAELGSLTEPK